MCYFLIIDVNMTERALVGRRTSLVFIIYYTLNSWNPSYREKYIDPRNP